MSHTAKGYSPADYDGQSPKSDSAFIRLERAVDTLMKAESIVTDLANQLVGERAEVDGAGKNLSPVRVGLIGTVDEKAERVLTLAERIINNVQRVNSQL